MISTGSALSHADRDTLDITVYRLDCLNFPSFSSRCERLLGPGLVEVLVPWVRQFLDLLVVFTLSLLSEIATAMIVALRGSRRHLVLW